MITTHDLTKKYGDLFAIRSIELNLDRGDLFGFIGPNGAGKTTTMRIISTLLQPSWGEAYVDGNSIYNKAAEIRRLVGYMPDFFGVYDDMKVIEYLEFFAAAYRIRGEARRKRCNEMLEIVDLDFKRDAYANTLSRGQTQRLGLARVMLHDPQVLLLDEPLSGLDPRARIEMRNLLRRLGQMGKTIIVSSHILPELADVCNKIGIIDRGVMQHSASVADVMKHVRRQTVLFIEVAANNGTGVDSAAKLLEQQEIVDRVETQGGRLVITLKAGVEDYTTLPTRLVEAGHRIKKFQEEELSLEAAFMALTKGMGEKNLMPIRFHCSGCQYLLQVPDDAAGKKARCPRCQNVADVPLSSQATDEAALHGSPGEEYRLSPPEQPTPNPSWSPPKPLGPLPTKPISSDNPYQSPSYGYDEPKYGVSTGDGKSPIRPTRIVMEDVFRYGWEIYNRQMGILIGVGVAVMGFNVVRGMFANFLNAMMERDGVDPAAIQAMVQGINLVTWPLVVFLEVGQAIVFLKVARGQPVEFGELFSGGRYLLRALGGSFLYNLAVTLGMCALIVPGILLSLMLWPYLLFIVDRDQRVFESFSTAQEFTNGNKGTMFVVFLANAGIMLLGCLALGIGLIFAYPLVMMMTTVAYLMMTGQFYKRT